MRALRPVTITAALTAGIAVAGIVAMAVHAHAGPATTSKRATVLSGGAAKVSLLPPTVTNLNATLTDYTGNPVPGATIAFTTHEGSLMCTARTNRSGYAACDDTGSVTSVTSLKSGYIAQFDGNNAYLPSTGFGNVQPL